MKNYFKNIETLKFKFSECTLALRFRNMFFTSLTLLIFYGCNLCPTSPSGDSSNQKNYIYSTLIPINSNEPIITKISTSNLSFSEIAKNGYIFSSPAINGNFAFIRVDTIDNKKILMLGNIFSNTFQILEKENKDFSIFNPIISNQGDKIAFLGGSGQFYIWVLNTSTNASYIDKISNKVFDNSLPVFSPNGEKIVFLEKETDNSFTLKIIEASKPDNLIFSQTFDSEKIQEGIDNFISYTTDFNKIAFVSHNDTNDVIRTLDNNTHEIKEIYVKRENFGIKIAKISPDGKFIVAATNDGNLWSISLLTEQPLFSKLSNVSPCNNFLYFDWNSDGTKILAQSYNCNDDINKGSTLYVINLISDGDLLVAKDISLYCNNIQRAFWGN